MREVTPIPPEAATLPPPPPTAGQLASQGEQCFARRDYVGAASAFRDALRLQPDNAAVWSNFAAVLYEQHQLDDSILAAREALRLAPGMLEAWNNLGTTLNQAGRPMEAVDAYQAALTIKPSSDVWSNQGSAYKAAGRIEDALTCYGNALALDPTNWRAWSNMLLVLHYSEKHSIAEIAAAHRQFGDAAGTPPAKLPAKTPKKRLRIGLVSADFYNHPVGRLLLPVLQAKQGGRFEWFGYLNNPFRDSVTEQICQALDGARLIASASDQAFAQQVAIDDIDILIDLSGHTRGNRLRAFNQRMAPVQATWLGYAFTTGLPAMDFIIADPGVLPLTDVELYTETPVYLPHFYLLAGQPKTTLKPSPPPMLRQAYPTFGSFNNPAKISAQVLALWVRLLRETPNSRLLFKSKAYADATLCQKMRTLFANDGVASERLSFESESWGDSYFESYSRIDIALDPFPFPGLMTSLDTLWMGVPVVTLQARGGILGRHAARLLELIGHPEWVAHSEDDYLRVVGKLLADPQQLATWRSSLRTKMSHAAFMDGQRFVSDFEAVLVAMAATKGITLDDAPTP
ncbi:MAG: tetratricopeptide repeat protein [Dechloromonas sp.]|nr:tetratricopeptide repeat protein [Dechloromonas sp.]